MARTFYVYTLSDPRCGTVFYVGKGKGNRAHSHTKDVKAGRCRGNSIKAKRIADIIQHGLEPNVVVVESFDIEAEALNYEEALIAVMPNLTNMRARGSIGALTREEAQRRLDERQTVKRVIWLKSWLAKIDSWQDVEFPNVSDGVAKARDFVAAVREIVRSRDSQLLIGS